MATITPKHQKFFDLNDKAKGVTIGITTIKLVSTSDTFRVPTLSKDTGSAKQLERTSDPTVTVGTLDVDGDGFYRTIRLSGAVGGEVVIATIHQGAFNFNEDEDS